MLKAKLAEAEHGSRPEEIAKAKADLEQAQADQENAKVTLDRTRDLVQQKVLSKQALGRCASQLRRRSGESRLRFERTYELVRLDPARKRSMHFARKWSKRRARSTTLKSSSKTP